MDEERDSCWSIYTVKMIKGAFEDDANGLKILLYIINIVCFFSPSVMIIYILDSKLLIDTNWMTLFMIIMISGALYNLLRYTTMVAHIKYDRKEKKFVQRENFKTINYNVYICNMMGLTTAIIFITNIAITFANAKIHEKRDIMLYILATLSVVIFWGTKRVYYVYLSKSKNK